MNPFDQIAEEERARREEDHRALEERNIGIESLFRALEQYSADFNSRHCTFVLIPERGIIVLKLKDKEGFEFKNSVSFGGVGHRRFFARAGGSIWDQDALLGQSVDEALLSIAKAVANGRLPASVGERFG